MRPIKFRGRDIKTGEFVFGDLINSIPSVSLPCIVIEDVVCDVAPESVAQLVGYDANGKEVYEGDKMINDRDNTTFKAAMNHIYTVKQYRLLED